MPSESTPMSKRLASLSSAISEPVMSQHAFQTASIAMVVDIQCCFVHNRANTRCADACTLSRRFGGASRVFEGAGCRTEDGRSRLCKNREST
eukprot:7278365-Prymnesium_polylepis.1